MAAAVRPVSLYSRLIAESLRRQGLAAVEPRLIEGWMRLECGTLDGLTHSQFDNEVSVAFACVQADGAGSERLARSYGL